MTLELVYEIVEHVFDGRKERYAIKKNGIHQKGFYVRSEEKREDKLKEAKEAFEKFKQTAYTERIITLKEIILSEEI